MSNVESNYPCCLFLLFCMNRQNIFKVIKSRVLMHIMARIFKSHLLLLIAEAPSHWLWRNSAWLDAAVGQHRGAEWPTVTWFQENNETQVGLKSVGQTIYLKSVPKCWPGAAVKTMPLHENEQWPLFPRSFHYSMFFVFFHHVSAEMCCF